ncbi:MAG: DNA polymerase/3'-5' exonuclease PolX [Candidatus Micrarchaeota archaeon]|nr:MAG: DNA polymerase/3'-5' exonuclease PolX [Candidatus Micrarchaeota archaeon]
MYNNVIADIFEEISIMISLENTSTSKFESRAYARAAETIRSLQTPIEDIYNKGGKEALTKLSGIGKGMADKIEEYIKTGHISKYDELKKKYPINFLELMKIEGIGAKTAYNLYKALGVKNLDDLKKALNENKLRAIEGFGDKSIQQLKEAIEMYESSKGRVLLGYIYPIANNILDELKRNKNVIDAYIAGSTRRMKETVGDLDILVTSDNPVAVMDYFVSLPEVDRVIVKGDTKTTVWLKIGLSCDLRVIPKESIGAALQYFTGSKQHNVKLREIAIKNGYKLNEYGLYDSKEVNIAEGKDEAFIYNALGLDYIEPELREDRGEIELAMQHRLPKLIKLEDIKGDLHMHTKETDGTNSLEEMVNKALSLKRSYIAITNHTKSLKVAHGMDEKQFIEFFKEIDRLNERLNGKIKILKGAEVDILQDGSLDLDRNVLEQMDCVVASVHSHFNMSKEEMTARVIKALESNLVNILGHPTGRMINQREPYEIDLFKVAEAAERYNVALEINAFPDRLDLSDSSILMLKDYNIKFSIDTDSHNINHEDYMLYGVATARRGFLTKDRIINTLSLEELERFLSK